MLALPDRERLDNITEAARFQSRDLERFSKTCRFHKLLTTVLSQERSVVTSKGFWELKV
jgi:hypothetical protein